MAQALLEGQMAVIGGRIDVARQWLERAAALAPTDIAAQLVVLAAVKLMLRSDEAAELYAGVVKEHDLREAWLGLAAAHHLRSEAAQAADALGHAFRRHVVPASNFTFSPTGSSMPLMRRVGAL